MDGDLTESLTQSRRRPDHHDVDVSVFMPVRNEAAGILESAAAIQRQRFDGSIELLFIDGRSEDGSRAILEALSRANPSIRILDNAARDIAPALNSSGPDPSPWVFLALGAAPLGLARATDPPQYDHSL